MLPMPASATCCRASSLGAIVLDTSGRVEFINDFLLGLLGRSRDELVGRDWIDIAIPEDERAALRETFAASIASGAGAGQREDGIVTRSGEERRLLWTSVIQRDADGRVVGLAGIAHDVTEARRIAAEHARLAAAIEQSAESVMITDPATRILYVNRAFERLSGYASAEVVGQTPRILASGVQSTVVLRRHGRCPRPRRGVDGRCRLSAQGRLALPRELGHLADLGRGWLDHGLRRRGP